MRSILAGGCAAIVTLTSLQVLAACGDSWQKQWAKCDGSLGCGIRDIMSVPVAAIPKYDLTAGDGRTRQGMSWELLVAAMPNDGACHPWEQDVALGLAWYPWVTPDKAGSSLAARATWQTWIPDRKRDSTGFKVRVGAGAGGHAGLGGAGPRVEGRIWMGLQEEGYVRIFGLFVSAAYEPELLHGKHRAHIGAGIEWPFVL